MNVELIELEVDPFTSISAIERYLLDRGVGYVRGEDSSGDEDASDDDEMPSVRFYATNFVTVIFTNSCY